MTKIDKELAALRAKPLLDARDKYALLEEVRLLRRDVEYLARWQYDDGSNRDTRPFDEQYPLLRADRALGEP